MRELISEHFINEHELTEWSKEIYEKVIFELQIDSKDLVFQFAEEFSERCLYIAINATVKKKDDISGKFCFHSMYNNVGAFIRKPEPLIPAYPGLQFFLVYIDGLWYIQSHASYSPNAATKNKCFLWGKPGGYVRLDTGETNPLLLNDETQWEEADGHKGWTFQATIKIFNNEEEYKNYRNTDVL